jgi:outer membrane scaffolding protein for murein synthesis (MipA/OmpV family)
MHAKNNFERSGMELTIAYVAFPAGALSLTPYAGIQYTDHKWSFKSSSEKVDIDDSWVDGVIGLKLAYMINQEWTRNNCINYAAGDSEGCLGIQTGVSWQWTESWIAEVYNRCERYPFESSNKRLSILLAVITP